MFHLSDHKIYGCKYVYHRYLQFDGVHVVSGSLDTSIRVWDVETGACRHALMGHQSLTSGTTPPPQVPTPYSGIITSPPQVPHPLFSSGTTPPLLLRYHIPYSGTTSPPQVQHLLLLRYYTLSS